MITICVMFASKGSVCTKLKMMALCLGLDAIYLIPTFA
jgi:hypothetical protein